MGQHKLLNGDGDLPPQQVYQALLPRLAGRLALLPPLKVRATLASGVLSAPVGFAAVAFFYTVGADSLMAWDSAVARRSLAILEEAYEAEVMRANEDGAGGYFVESTCGLLLAAFADPALALSATCSTVAATPQLPWPSALLENALCEELTVTGVGPDGELVQTVLFRGLRVKAGLDYGPVQASLNAATGRLSYRGRVMNRAARIANSATSGQAASATHYLPAPTTQTQARRPHTPSPAALVLCSRDLWAPAAATAANLRQPVTAISAGSTQLKGVPERVEIMVCRPAPPPGAAEPLPLGMLMGSGRSRHRSDSSSEGAGGDAGGAE
ncbi:hypothetical protein GPECTOR_12g454 [Gonium pectorale]|uniref:Guanylate cyclase domain-containing protein n=1 Tax=Gonium pectorale TaxID=33097 RepID=A0A150GNV9_GONPE|nr:hypothetical protein GPECTOR_12g454 [Gonium pectorale]|eukprot:KXZ51491.1 hypothetical protein GPECTOR_12g454 [Gonium pectorale]